MRAHVALDDQLVVDTGRIQGSLAAVQDVQQMAGHKGKPIVARLRCHLFQGPYVFNPQGWVPFGFSLAPKAVFGAIVYFLRLE